MSNFWKNKNISITGGSGFLGKHVRKRIEQRNCKKILIVDHKKYNLVDLDFNCSRCKCKYNVKY